MRVRLASLIMGALAAATLGLSAAAPAMASTARPAASGSGVFCLQNDSGTCMHGNGVGQQITTSFSGNGMNVTSVAEGTNCGGLTVWSFHDGHGNWFRIPTGADTLNLSTTRAEFVYLGNGAYGSLVNGCSSDTNGILIHGDLHGIGVFVMSPVSGDWTEWARP